MNYVSGELVMLGDKVELGCDSQGIVVCVIDDGKYSQGYPEAEWSDLNKGALIEFPLYGLVHYELALEPDVRLIGRLG